MDEIRVFIIGARRNYQGIGEFLAKWFVKSEAKICGILGSNENSVQKALENLDKKYNIKTRGYTNIKKGIEKERPHIVSISSPFSTHKYYLDILKDLSVHCLCEKPLWFDDSISMNQAMDETKEILQTFENKGYYFDSITQWPYTLPYYFDLYENIKDEKKDSFAMRISPKSDKPKKMIIDCAPHLISMLFELWGEGTFTNISYTIQKNKVTEVYLKSTFVHNNGKGDILFSMIPKDNPPRPASYAINGLNAQRKINMPDYIFSLEGNNKEIKLIDPLELLVKDYLVKIKNKTTPKFNKHLMAIRELYNLVNSLQIV